MQPNKAMKLTRLAAAPGRMRQGAAAWPRWQGTGATASQLIAGVRRTQRVEWRTVEVLREAVTMSPRWVLQLPRGVVFLAFGPIQVVTAGAMILAGRYVEMPLGAKAALMGMPALLCVGVLLGWLWSVGRAFNDSLPGERRWQERWLDVAVGYSAAYITVFMAVFPWPGTPIPTPPLAVIGVAHVVAMLAVLFAFVWITRAIVWSRCGRFDMAFAVLILGLLWMYPVGVWVVHPWAQKLLGNGKAVS